MNLFRKLKELDEKGEPLRVALIGAGKFGSMYLAQAPKTPGVHIAAIADLSLDRARENLKRIGWTESRHNTTTIDEAVKTGKTHLTEDWKDVVSHPEIDIIVECTGNPIAAVDHCLACFNEGKDIINVTVEADAFCGPALAEKAKSAGVIYSLAYGDQPALAVELVDTARASGFPVAAAGRGHKWLPAYRESTPETVWDHWGLTAEQARIGGLNPKMFNAFLDGSKPAIESTAIANAAGLAAPSGGLSFPPGSIDDIPTLMRPRSEGGVLEGKGMVEVVSSQTREGRPIPYDIRKGVWVCIEADTDYIQRCFEEYKVVTDPSGRYMCVYRRWHLIGLELGVSVANVGLRKEATGVATTFSADTVATAKRNLNIGERLDGEGGYTVFGKLSPASASQKNGFLPLGLAHNLTLVRPVAKDNVLTWDDVKLDESLPAFKLRREMEANHSSHPPAG
jgi:predicted homoserine dehydrogenase-like protein